jgi:delta1-piperideine-2-carboxylate reductase
MTVVEIASFAEGVLAGSGMAREQAQAVAAFVAAAERDDCPSHGLYRLLGMLRTIAGGKVGLAAEPTVSFPRSGIVAVDAHYGFSPLAFAIGRPLLEAQARATGLAALVVRNCFHFSALWAEVEPLAEAGFAALAMTPSHSWVAPAGGKQPVFGTNPIAFGFPRTGHFPFVFDFATSAVSRGEIELHGRAGKQVPLGWGVDTDGASTTDPAAILKGAMSTFGGHKGAALAMMVELLGAALIGDLTSMESLAFDAGDGGAPMHGEIVIAFDPAGFAGTVGEDHHARAETIFGAVTSQGLRLPSDRRYAARQLSLREGVRVPRALLDDIAAALNKPAATQGDAFSVA